MRFTHLIEKQGEDGKKMYAFYEGDALACLFHEDDVTWEYKQIAFILEKASVMPGFGYLDYQDRSLMAFGLDRNQVVDLDCKLINFQWGSKISLDRQLMVGGYDAE